MLPWKARDPETIQGIKNYKSLLSSRAETSEDRKEKPGPPSFLVWLWRPQVPPLPPSCCQSNNSTVQQQKSLASRDMLAKMEKNEQV